MIDLHSHILPTIDDGARSLDVSVQMARIAVADGIHTMACTPHIYPGLYLNDKPGISRFRNALQGVLDLEKIPLKLVVGADVHLVPDLLSGLRNGTIPTLNDSRYILLEPSHHVAPPRFADSIFQLVVAGYTPVITHPERLTWIEGHYPVFVNLIQQGAWIQVTADALTGLFGPRAKYWAEKFVGEGHTHILASDAHSNTKRTPRLSPGLAVAERLLGAKEARRLVVDRPAAILENLAPSDAAPLPAVLPVRQTGWLGNVMRKFKAGH
jgi:protein-tyrosine phosphatase